MTDWLKQYTSALEARDAREQAHKPYIDAYTLLAERSRPSPAPIKSNQSPQPASATADGASTSSPARRSKPAAGTTKGASSPSSPQIPSHDTDTTDLDTLRADLATTQKARATLAATLAATLHDTQAQLSQLQLERGQNLSQIEALSRAKLEVERKLRDRDEELRGKDRLVEQAQDEMVAQGLQLHVAEDKAEKLTRENKELVDRWMRRMEAEADKVNRDSRWS